jgi:hypothetical protein
MTFQPAPGKPIDSAIALQLSLLFGEEEAEAEALFRIIARLALDTMHQTAAQLRGRKGRDKGREDRRNLRALEWALDFAPDALPQAVGLLSKDLRDFARSTLYTPEERAADRDADRNFADDGRDLLREREALLAEALARINSGEMSTREAAAQLNTLLEGASFNLPHYLREGDNGRTLLDERFARFLDGCHSSGDEGNPARILDGLSRDFDNGGDLSPWRVAMLDNEGAEHLLGPDAEAVAEGGEILLEKTAPAIAPAPPLFRQVERSRERPGDDIPLFDFDTELAAQVIADAEESAFYRDNPELPLPVTSAIAERWIPVAIALWATGTRSSMRNLLASVTAHAHAEIGAVLAEGSFHNVNNLDLSEISYRIATPIPARLRGASSRNVAPRYIAHFNPEGADRGFDAVTFTGRKVKPQRAIEDYVPPILGELARTGSKVAASAAGRAIVFHLIEEMTKLYNSVDVYTRRRIHLGELKPQIIIQGGFAGLAERIGDRDRGEGYPQFFELFSLLRFEKATRSGGVPLGQLLSYRVLPAGPGQPAELRVILHDALLPFSYAKASRRDRSALVPIIANVPRPATLSRQLYRAHDNFADAVIRYLVEHYEQALDLGGVELGDRELEELAARYAPAILPHLARSFEALVKGEPDAPATQRRRSAPILHRTGPGRYRIGDAFAEAHAFALEGAKMRDAGRRRSAGAIAAEKSERRQLGEE